MILVTSGCSFTEVEIAQTWAYHLAPYFKNHYSEALSSQGNGLIARRLVYRVSKLLETHSPDDILVGVMWSGPNRGELYVEKDVKLKIYDGWHENPITYADNDKGNWVIVNQHWENDYAKHYYKYHSYVFDQVKTLEYILLVQMFLKQYNIKYFMGHFMDYTFSHELYDWKTNPNTAHLMKMIDWDYFLPEGSEFSWVVNNTDLMLQPDGSHPSGEQHKEYTNTIIIPFLKNKYHLKLKRKNK